MAERRIVVDRMIIRYDGLFNFQELYHMIENWFRQKGYDFFEHKNYEQTLKDGKDIEIVLRPYKKTSDYHKLSFRIFLFVKSMKDVTINKDGIDIKMNHGQIQITINAFVSTDYFGRWEGRPIFWFLRLLFDKFMYKVQTESQMQFLTEDVNHLYSYINAYLNMARKAA